MENTTSNSVLFSSLSWGLHEFAASSFVSVQSTLLVLCLFVSLFIVKAKGRTRGINKQKPALPPGPTPWPIIGNIPEIFSRKNKPNFRWIHGLMKELNTDIACIKLASTHVIPVTSPEIAREFLRKYDSVFASRPITMATEYSSRGFLTIAVVPLGDQWRKMRKVVASEMVTPARLRWLLGKRNEEADNLVRFIYNQCESNGGSSAVIDMRLAIRQYTGNVIRKMMFNRRNFGEGRKDGGPGREEVEHVESLFTVLNHLYSFALSDYIPWLRPLDLEGHEKIVSEAMRIISGYNDPIVNERVKEWKDGKRKEPEDLLDALILAKDVEGKPVLSVEEIKAQCTEIMFATVDNPANAVEWAMAEMLNRPEIIRKATEEIERVVGNQRWVQESDIPRLNYVKACARESLRLHPVAPFNLPHVSNADCVVAGYFIPKGSHVLLSRIGLGRNPKVWDKPLVFEPERHFKDGGSDEEIDLTETELKFLSFSTGRRACMGVALGSAMTVMLLARLVQGFSWRVPPNEAEIDLSESKNDLFLAKPLHAMATPRLPAYELYSPY
ncbi:Tryptophan N-monooxygenase 1 [Hibiscus syriacus]|uniref:Tryptophan N-monooxygenase 1 n=1 Tax=Hibiscus syriacus TaxID=106335 RepID=A0A6A3BY53_HIBSY|nr:phenylalanine N-monooxygenase-like [Hibiscus syriacus]KAE8721596.1 Tryptophan N-monooxygenase 1 [Hibiscus syriacus]